MDRPGRVALFSRVDLKEAVEVSRRVKSLLESYRVEVLVDELLRPRIGGELWDPSSDIDMLITVGGDGTILRGVHKSGLKAPIFAVRMGLVGFLAECEAEEASENLKKVLRGEFRLEKYRLLENSVELPPALNDVRIGTMDVLKTVDLEVKIDGETIAVDRVDAILAATPLGSTGYSLSCGGCILDPRVEAFIVTPISPLTPSFKPYVAPWSSKAEFKSLRGELQVAVDGTATARLPEGSKVEVRGSEKTVSFVRVGRNFIERLPRRLHPKMDRFRP